MGVRDSETPESGRQGRDELAGRLTSFVSRAHAPLAWTPGLSERRRRSRAPGDSRRSSPEAPLASSRGSLRSPFDCTRRSLRSRLATARGTVERRLGVSRNLNPEEDIPGCSLTTFAALPGCDFQGFKSGRRRPHFPTRIARGASLLLRAARRVAPGKLSGLAGTERSRRRSRRSASPRTTGASEASERK